MEVVVVGEDQVCCQKVQEVVVEVVQEVVVEVVQEVLEVEGPKFQRVSEREVVQEEEGGEDQPWWKEA